MPYQTIEPQQDYTRKILETLAAQQDANDNVDYTKESTMRNAMLPEGLKLASDFGGNRTVAHMLGQTPPPESNFAGKYFAMKEGLARRKEQEEQQNFGTQQDVLMGLQKGVDQRRNQEMAAMGKVAGKDDDLRRAGELERYKAELRGISDFNKAQIGSPVELNRGGLGLAPIPSMGGKGSGKNSPQSPTTELPPQTKTSAGDGRKLSKGQEAIDTNFAKNVFVPYMTQGQYAQDLSAINNLDRAIKMMESEGAPASGGVLGLLPDSVRTFVNPKSMASQEGVEDSIKFSLKQVLGAQFGEKEGQKLLSLSFNKGLPPKENIYRAKKIQKMLLRMVKAKQDAAKYFQENNTLRGYGGDQFLSIDDLINEAEKEFSGLQPQTSGATQPDITMKDQAPETGMKSKMPAVGEIRNGFRFKGGDPNDQASWERTQ